jgi:hypothetical protein
VRFVPPIDLDNFDEKEYFGSDKHCVAVAFALHLLTGWPIYDFWTWGKPWGHLAVKSPLGFLDTRGLDAGDGYEMGTYIRDRRGARPVRIWLEATRRETEAIIQEELSAEDYLNEWDDTEGCQSKDYLERVSASEQSLDLAMPLARAILARYFPDLVLTEPAEQLELFEQSE